VLLLPLLLYPLNRWGGAVSRADVDFQVSTQYFVFQVRGVGGGLAWGGAAWGGASVDWVLLFFGVGEWGLGVDAWGGVGWDRVSL